MFLALSAVFLFRQWGRGWSDVIDSDGIGYFAHLPSLLLDQNIDYSNEFARFSRPTRNHWPIGTAILWSPFFLLGHLISILGHYGGASWPTDGTGLPEQYAVCLGTIFYFTASLGICSQLCQKFFDRKNSLASVLLLFLSSNMIYYALAEPYMSHGVSAFLSSVLFLLCTRDKELSRRDGLLYGVLGGLMALTRPQDGLLIGLPFLLAVYRGQSLRTLALPLVTSGGVSLILFLPQVHIWFNQPGKVVSEGVVPGGHNYWFDPVVLETLVNPLNGLFLWNPIFLFASLGLLYGAAHRRGAFLVALAGFLVQLYVVASWGGQGQSFGGRMFLVCSCFFALGLCQLIEASRKGMRVLLGLIGIALILLNLAMSIKYRSLVSSNPAPSVYEVLDTF